MPSSHKRPAHFDAANPADISGSHLDRWDNIVKDAHKDGVTVLFDVMGGAPLWATGHGAPKEQGLLPVGAVRQPVRAVRARARHRYSGDYDPKTHKLAPGNRADLPAVTSWSIWNEPDYGPSLAPQGLPGHLRSITPPRCTASSWTPDGLPCTSPVTRRHDSVRELAPRGENNWGVFSGMKPLVFLRSMYCVDSHYRPLRGTAASDRGCPTTSAGSRGSGPPTRPCSGPAASATTRTCAGTRPTMRNSPDPAYTSLGEIGNLEHALDRVQAVYGSRTRFPIYDTEFGYLTSPPKHDNQIESGNVKYPWVSQKTAADYLNWAEYIHWHDPRIASFAQYLLYDPMPALKSNDWGSFASGLINYGPREIPKATYYAWRMPIYMPVTSTRSGEASSVWGCVRPAPFALEDTGQPQMAQIQFAPGSSSSFTTIESVIGGECR